MREELKRLIGENISGTAKCILNGRRCLLRDIKIDNPIAFDPDDYLSITQHLWTDSSIIKENNIKRYSYFKFTGSVYEYKRSNKSIDYSIEMTEIMPINTMDYLKSKMQQNYCRDGCMFYEHCDYNCCMPKEAIDEYVMPALENTFLHEAMFDFAEEYEFSPKDFLKGIKEKSAFKIGNSNIYLGMYKADFINRYQGIIDCENNFGYKLKPIKVDNIAVTPVLHFICNGMCDAIVFEVSKNDFGKAIQYINKKYNTKAINLGNIKPLNLFEAEIGFDDVTFGYTKSSKKKSPSILMSLSTPISSYFISQSVSD